MESERGKSRPFHGLAFYLFFGQGGRERGVSNSVGDNGVGVSLGEEGRREGGREERRESGEEEWETSNADNPKACTNWMNVFVPVGRGGWVVEEGEEVECESRCYVGEAQPWYEMIVTVRKREERGEERRGREGNRTGRKNGGGGRGKEGREGGREVKYRESVYVHYCDLVCRVDSVRGWRKFFASQGKEEREGGKGGGREGGRRGGVMTTSL